MDPQAGRNTGEPGGPTTALAWHRWPEGLRTRGHQVLAELNSGHPQAALDLIDELLADLLARRDTAAESANRQFEPSTDDRRP